MVERFLVVSLFVDLDQKPAPDLDFQFGGDGAYLLVQADRDEIAEKIREVIKRGWERYRAANQ
jgi:hypothetical protein